MNKEFTVSMFASKEALYKAKSEYLEQQVAELTEKLAAAESRANRRSLEEYNDLMEGAEEPDTIERLRFFCSIAMLGNDWLDVEPFFDDVIAYVAKERQAGRDEYQKEMTYE